MICALIFNSGLLRNAAWGVSRPNVVVSVLPEVRQRPEEEGSGLHEHPAWRQDTHIAGQLVCRSAQTQQSGALLLKTLPEATKSPVVCLHVATGESTVASHASGWQGAKIKKYIYIYQHNDDNDLIWTLFAPATVFCDMRPRLSNTLHQVCGEGMYCTTFVFQVHWFWNNKRQKQAKKKKTQSISTHFDLPQSINNLTGMSVQNMHVMSIAVNAKEIQ